MNKALITLYSRVEVVRTGQISPLVRPHLVHDLNATIGGMGYSLDRDVMQALLGSTEDDFRLFVSELVRAFTDITNGLSDCRELFSDFPHETHIQRQNLLSRVVRLMRENVGITTPLGLLPCGHVIDPDVCDLEDTRACPICHYQLGAPRPVEEMQVEYRPEATPLKLLGLADAAFLTQRANELLARQTALSTDERSFLIDRLFQTEPCLTVPPEPHPEILPLAWSCLSMRGHLAEPLSPDRGSHLVRSATDVLRIAAFLSDPENADLSLKTATTFKLTPPRVRAILEMLDSLSSPEKDMWRYQKHWRKLAPVLKPDDAEHQERYPNAIRNLRLILGD